MTNLYALTDYKGFFGSKYHSKPYRSGLDQDALKTLFQQRGYNLEFCEMSKAHLLENIEKVPIVYTSSEDLNLYYKDYIEDVVLNLQMKGANVIPDYPYLRANNNKPFMEFMRQTMDKHKTIALPVWIFGSLDEMFNSIKEFSYPVVVKRAAGAMGKGVYLAKNEKELIHIGRQISHTANLKYDLKDFLRSVKHDKYKKESKFRKKFIVQQFVPNLINDWKVYVFGNKYFVFYRPIFKKRSFRASGGGYDNYFYGKNARIPDGLLDFAKDTFKLFNTPHISLDIAFDGERFYLLEFQFVYFGTAGILYSEEYFSQVNGNWQAHKSTLSQENCYADSIVTFLNR